jgi:hypothetical protein
MHSVPDSLALSDTMVRPVEASPKEVIAVLERLNPLRALEDALIALGFKSVSVEASKPAAAAPSGFVASWSLPEGLAARVACTFTVDPSGHGSSILSANLRAEADDARGQAQMIEAWPMIEPMVEGHVKRLFRSVVAMTEET